MGQIVHFVGRNGVRVTLILAVAIALASQPFTGLLGISGTCALSNTVHGPIVIESDLDFTAVNGVTSGSGTSADPYIIENLEIEGYPGTAITITGTTAHCIIRNVTIDFVDVSLDMSACSNITVENSLITSEYTRWAGVLEDVSDIVLRGNNVPGYGHGISIENGHHLTIEGNEIATGCMALGSQAMLYVSTSSDVLVTANNLSNVGEFRFQSCNNLTIEENVANSMLVVNSCTNASAARNNLVAMTIDSCVGFAAVDNELGAGGAYGTQGIRLAGSSMDHYATHTLTGNMVGGQAVYYHKNAPELVLEGGSAGQVIAVNCFAVAIIRMQMIGSAGVALYEGDTVEISDCNFSSSYFGIRLEGFETADIVRNNLSTTGIGAKLSDVNEFTFEDNFVRGFNGLSLRGCSGTVRSNVISDGYQGIYIEDCGDLLIFHNNFLNLTIPVDSWGITDSIRLDHGYPAGGNYWSDYTGADSDGDGIGDTEYELAIGLEDRYPLVEPYLIIPGPSPYTDDGDDGDDAGISVALIGAALAVALVLLLLMLLIMLRRKARK